MGEFCTEISYEHIHPCSMSTRLLAGPADKVQGGEREIRDTRNIHQGPTTELLGKDKINRGTRPVVEDYTGTHGENRLSATRALKDVQNVKFCHSSNF